MGEMEEKPESLRRPQVLNYVYQAIPSQRENAATGS
jgi:hypothetical protein